MDNLSKWYASRYEEAKTLAKQGAKDKCLEICWESRLEPDLSLYRRAHVNLLIALTVDIKEHPHAAKYAQECIDLIGEVLAQGFSNHLVYLKTIAVEARRVKDKIDRKLIELELKKTKEGDKAKVEAEEARWGRPLDLAEMEANIQTSIHGKFGPSEFSQMTLEDREPVRIEGMYTTGASDFGISTESASASKIVQDRMTNLKLEQAKHGLPTHPHSSAPDLQMAGMPDEI